MERISVLRWLLRPMAALFLVVGVALAGGPGAVNAQDSASVSIVDFAFEPGSMTVAAGTTVTWTNNGNAPHTVTADDGSFDSGTLNSGGTFSFTFDTPGTYSYTCTIHPQMTATIVVTGDDTSGGDTGGDDTNGDTGGDAGDDTTGDTGAGTTMPSTGAGTTALGGAESLMLPLAALALILGLVGLRVRRA